MSAKVTMPALGESVTEGTVTRWLKAEGDTVAIDEPLLEVSTDKVDTEIPSPYAGVIEKILVPVDSTVLVGADLVIINDGSAGSAAPVAAAPVAAPAAPAIPKPTPPAPPVAAPAAGDAASPEGSGRLRRRLQVVSMVLIPLMFSLEGIQPALPTAVTLGHCAQCAAALLQPLAAGA